MKYAELPDGKLLKFPDGTSDRDMQRAVRRELGLATNDILGALDTLSTKLVSGLEARDRQIEKLIAAFEPLTTSFKALTRTLQERGREEIVQQARLLVSQNEATKATREGHEKTDRALARAIEPLNKAVERLNTMLFKFEAACKDSMDHSTEAIQADLKATMKAVSTVTAGMAQVTEMAGKIEEFMEVLRDNAQMTRRAVPNGDGSWTLKPDRRNVQ